MVEDIWKDTSFSSLGWQLMSLQLDDSHIKKCRDYLWKTSNNNFVSIFQNQRVETEDKVLVPITDNKRMQMENFEEDLRTCHKKNWFHPLQSRLHDQLGLFQKDLVIKHWALLRSLPGCPTQSTHEDVPDLCFPCIMGIVSMDDSTTLNIPDKHGANHFISIPAGFVLYFRGDLIHGGSPYDHINTRIYFMAAGEGCEFSSNQEESISIAYRCQFLTGKKKGIGCGQSFRTQQLRHQHMNMHCLVCNTQEELDAKRQKKRAYSQNHFNNKKQKINSKPV